MRVGETTLTVADLASLPEGSEVEVGEGKVFTKCADGWYNLERTSMAANAYALVGARVRHVAREGEPLTVEQFKQRFATLAIGMAAAYSPLHVEAGRRMLSDLECSLRPPISLGMWVHTGDTDLIAQLPRGALLSHGHTHRTRNLYRYNGQELEPLTKHNRRYVCLELVDVPSNMRLRMWRPPRPGEAEALAAFKRQVWTIGWRYKVAGDGDGNEWCAAYEAILARVGLDASLVGEAPDAGTLAAVATGEGEYVDEAAQRALPVGAVIRWISGSGQRSRLKVRDDTAENDCLTRSLYVGEERNRFSRNAVQNQVVYLPGEDMSIPVFSTAELSVMPRGTILRNVGNEGRWIKQHFDYWHHITGGGIGGFSNQFPFVHDLRYIKIPGVN